MNNKFLIRTVAMKLLEKVYLSSDASLHATINAFDIVDNNIDKTIIQKASQYLLKKNLIETSKIAFDEWPVTITYKGIDWLEDCHNINPCDY